MRDLFLAMPLIELYNNRKGGIVMGLFHFSSMVIALIFVATPASAANWVYAGENTFKSAWYYDAETIQRTGSKVKVRLKIEHPQDDKAGRAETKENSIYDCDRKQITIVYFQVLYKDGEKKVFDVPLSQQLPANVVPESIWDTTLRAVCAATGN
jgi:hypothetical protein